MGSRVKKSRRSLIDEELRPSVPEKSGEERFEELLDFVSLKNMPLEGGRKEASKPLFLTRYE